MKKNILVIFGIGDSFCHAGSPRCIKRGKAGPRLAEEVTQLIEANKDDYWGYVFVHEARDTFNHVYPLKDVSPARVIDVKLCSGSLFSVNNQITLTNSDGSPGAALNGDLLDHVLPPDDFELTVVGIDINGVFKTLVREAPVLGYSTTILSDIIKPFSRDTVSSIISAKQNSHHSVVFRKS